MSINLTEVGGVWKSVEVRGGGRKGLKMECQRYRARVGGARVKLNDEIIR